VRKNASVKESTGRIAFGCICDLKSKLEDPTYSLNYASGRD
jgi:hypothetical protein